MEDLIAYFYLCQCGFGSIETFNALLDQKFLENPNDDTLLELEWHSSDWNAVAPIMYRLLTCSDSIKIDLFGKCLFRRLEAAYRTNSIPIAEFDSKCYHLWSCLPEEISYHEPFYTFNYAGDDLFYYGEAKTRKLYEKVFAFYK